MNRKIMPVDRYDLRNALLNLPGVWVCGKGYCVALEDLNNAIDDMCVVPKEALVKWLLESLEKGSETAMDETLEDDLGKLLTFNEIRKYAGMTPLNGHDEFLEVK